MKLQPNFSYQKYESKPEDAAEQFQHQLMREHILVANSINATIDDISFWTTERETSRTWVDGRRIWTVSVPLTTWGGGGTTNAVTLPIAGDFTVIDIQCAISNGVLSTSTTVNIPHVDVSVAANEIMIVRNGLTVNITSGGTNYSTYMGYVTVYYVK